MSWVRYRHSVLFVSLLLGCISGLPAQTSSTIPDECPGTTGLITAIHTDAVSIKNDGGITVFQVTGETKLWRGGDVRLSQLHLGDEVMVSCTVNQSGGAIATNIMANFTRWAGTITAIHPHSIVIVGGGGPGEAPGHVTVFIDGHTTYAQGTPKDLTIGRDLEVSGLDLGHKRVQASALNIWPSK